MNEENRFCKEKKRRWSNFDDISIFLLKALSRKVGKPILIVFQENLEKNFVI